MAFWLNLESGYKKPTGVPFYINEYSKNAESVANATGFP